MKWIVFLFTFFVCNLMSAQDNEFTQTYYNVKRYQGDSVIQDWTYEINSFVYNVNGTNGVLWKGANGTIDAFTVVSDPIIDYTVDGEEYEYRIVVSDVSDEEVMFIWFSHYDVVRLVFEDGLMMEFE